MLTVRTILILVAVLVADGAIAQSQQTQQKPSDHKNATTTNERGTENSPLVIKVLPSKEAESAAKDDREEKTASTWRPGWGWCLGNIPVGARSA
jgi:hypothetical protein